jgi:hypothetical protein
MSIQFGSSEAAVITQSGHVFNTVQRIWGLCHVWYNFCGMWEQGIILKFKLSSDQHTRLLNASMEETVLGCFMITLQMVTDSSIRCAAYIIRWVNGFTSTNLKNIMN